MGEKVLENAERKGRNKFVMDQERNKKNMLEKIYFLNSFSRKIETEEHEPLVTTKIQDFQILKKIPHEQILTQSEILPGTEDIL